MGSSLGLGVLLVVSASASPVIASPGSEFRSFAKVELRSSAAEAAASELAVAEGQDVIVESATTETIQVVAQPDGTFEMTINTVPVRVQQEGVWVPIDTALDDDGSGFLAPEATTVPVQFSSGGSDVLARVQSPDGSWLSEIWPLGDLPAPKVSGATATYSEVLPDVDLRLTATATGMNEVLVIKTAEAAAHPDLASLEIGIEGADLVAQSDGSLSVDAAGGVAGAPDGEELRSSVPLFWDSSETGSGPNGPGGTEMGSTVEADVNEDSLTLEVGATVDDEDLTYPVFVDPDWTGGLANVWFIDSAYPNSSYVNGKYGQVAVGHIDGYYDENDGLSHTARSFWSMNTSGVMGKAIIAAHLNTTETWAFNCTPHPVQLWWTGTPPVGSTWNNTSVGYLQLLDTQNVAWGNEGYGCGDHSVGFNALAGVKGAAAANAPLLTLGMRVPDESNTNSWKQFSNQASLTITYNTRPNKPTSPLMTSPPRSCSFASTAPSFVNGTQALTLQVNSTDPDGGNVKTAFLIEKKGATNLWSTALPVALYPDGYAVTPLQAQGPQSVTFPANLLTPGLYRWYAYTRDSTAGSSSLSLASSNCYFQIENAPPAAPSVAAQAPGPYTVGMSSTVRFTSTVTDQAAVFAYWWVASGSTSSIPPPVTAGYPLPACSTGVQGVRYVCADASGLSPVVTVAPVATISTLWVVTYDSAGNVSPARPVSYSAQPDTIGVSYTGGHGWPTVDESGPLGATLADANTSAGLPLNLFSGLDPNAVGDIAGFDQPVIGIPGNMPAEIALTNGPAVNTVTSFSVSAWLKPAPLPASPADRVAISQVGPNTAAFELGESAAGTWQFCMRSQTAASTRVCVQGGPAVADTWQFLVGVWDASNQQLRLYVGDDAAGTAAWRPLPAGEVTGSVRVIVGAGMSASAWSDPWRGQVAHPHVFPGVPSQAQRARLFDQYGPNP